MMDITAIFIVGFVVLGIYKLIALFARRKERILLIEKLPIIINNKEGLAPIDLPNISFGSTDYGWALRISLLLVGIGLGCIVSFFLQILAFPDPTDHIYTDLIALVNIACITFFGGIGLFVAYMIELKRIKCK